MSGILEQPVFIVGTPRSGTTLVRLVLNSHPDLAIVPESSFLLRFAAKVSPYYGSLKTEKDLRKYIRDISETPKVRDWFSEPFDFEALLEEQKTGKISVAKVIQEVYRQYAFSKGKSYWGDKTPRNIQFFNEIVALFPNSKFILVVRDCRGVFLSHKNIDFGSQAAVVVAKRWVRDAQIAQQLLKHYSDQVMLIKYEDFLHEPQKKIDAILDFLNLAPCRDILSRYAQHEDDVGHSKSDLYRMPITPKNAYKWKYEINIQELMVCQKIARAELEHFGYEILPLEGKITLATIISEAFNIITQFGNKTFLENYIGFAKLAVRRLMERFLRR